MSTCINEETLSAYCDGVLDTTERTGVQAHLEGCWHCRRIESDYRALDQKIHTLPDLEVPDNFRANLMAKLEHRHRQSWFRKPWFGGLVAAAMLIMLVGSAYSELLPRPKSADKAINQVQVAGQETSVTQAPSTTQEGSLDRGLAGTKSQLSKEASWKGTEKSYGGSYSYPDQIARQDEKVLYVELQAKDVQEAYPGIIKVLGEFVGTQVISMETVNSHRVTVKLKVPGPETINFLARLESVGTVVNGEFRSNIGQLTGETIVNINVTSP